MNAKEISKIKNVDDFDLNPQCVEIFNKGNSQGKLLISLCLLKTINKNNQGVFEKFDSICKVKTQKFNFKLSCLGLRNLSLEVANPIILFSIKSQNFKQIFTLDRTQENKKVELIRPISGKFWNCQTMGRTLTSCRPKVCS